MISASHNPFEDNGIKLFGPDGFKLSDATEAEIEELMASDLSGRLAAPSALGRASRLTDAAGRYIEGAKATFPRGQTLEGLRIVVDCANGAGYRVAPTVLWELGATVIPLGVAPDGFNINLDCGSTVPEHLCAEVVARGAHLGIALDGRCRPPAAVRRARAAGGWRPDPGAGRPDLAARRPAARRGGGGDGHVQSRAGALSCRTRGSGCTAPGWGTATWWSGCAPRG